MSKARTDGIERNHCRQGHWFGRFKRKSIIVSKAKDMVELTMALFARFRVNGDVAEIFPLDMITQTILSLKELTAFAIVYNLAACRGEKSDGGLNG
jgi:hypothetical protein